MFDLHHQGTVLVSIYDSNIYVTLEEANKLGSFDSANGLQASNSISAAFFREPNPASAAWCSVLRGTSKNTSLDSCNILHASSGGTTCNTVTYIAAT